jgi:hypothetical protein
VSIPVWVASSERSSFASRSLSRRRRSSKCAADRRQRALGEEARWRYAHGAALVGLNEHEKAERELRAVLEIEAPRWLQGRARKELGKLADLAGDRSNAIREYRIAFDVCRAEHDSACLDELMELLKSGYQGLQPTYATSYSAERPKSPARSKNDGGRYSTSCTRPTRAPRGFRSRSSIAIS